MAVEVSERMLAVFNAIARKVTPGEACAQFGFSPQAFSNYVRKLVDAGLIRRRGDVPEGTWWDQEYPFEVIDQPVLAAPPPPTARLRLAFPVDSQRDLTVPPVRVVVWQGWVVQAVTPLGLDGTSGRHSNDRLPEFRVVVAAHVDALTANPEHPEEEAQVFLASVRRRWFESDTAALGWDGDDRADMTRVIACAVGVEAVLDLTVEEGSDPPGRWVPGEQVAQSELDNDSL